MLVRSLSSAHHQGKCIHPSSLALVLILMQFLSPFLISCGNRYTHANRTCPIHPYHKPQRSTELVLQPNIGAGENTDDVQKWLENYKRERMDKTPGKTPGDPSSSIPDTPVSPRSENVLLLPSTQQRLETAFDLGVRASSADVMAHELCKRNRIKRGLVSELEQENISKPPNYSPSSSPMKNGLNLIQPGKVRRTLGDITPKKDNNILPPEPLDNARNIPQSPIRSLNPKKRWMKTVVREQQKIQVVTPSKAQDEENLAMPIRWNDNESSPMIRRFANSSPDKEAANVLLGLAASAPRRPSPLKLDLAKSLPQRLNLEPLRMNFSHSPFQRLNLVDLAQSTPQPLNLSTNRR